MRQGKHTTRLWAKRCDNILHAYTPLATRQGQDATPMENIPHAFEPRAEKNTYHMSSGRAQENVPRDFESRNVDNVPHAFGPRAKRTCHTPSGNALGKAYRTSSGHALREKHKPSSFAPKENTPHAFQPRAGDKYTTRRRATHRVKPTTRLQVTGQGKHAARLRPTRQGKHGTRLGRRAWETHKTFPGTRLRAIRQGKHILHAFAPGAVATCYTPSCLWPRAKGNMPHAFEPRPGKYTPTCLQAARRE